jgi:hypothetical protein
MSEENWARSDAQPVSGGLQDAQDIAAGLLLRRVETMLRNGQPRQAIAHICEMTGAEPKDAEAFVADLKSRLFG